MKIVERKVGDVVILDLHGRILSGEGERALREAVGRLADSGTANLLVNFADVPYVDSSIVGEIVRMLTTVSRTGGKLKLLSLPARVRSLLSMTRLLAVFETYESEDEAVRSF
jgi:anti-sigma B factor antagonist